MMKNDPSRVDCPKCGDIEPDHHEETWWFCSCSSKAKSINIKEALEKIEKEGVSNGFKRNSQRKSSSQRKSR